MATVSLVIMLTLSQEVIVYLELEHQEGLAQLLAGHKPQHKPELELEQGGAPPEHDGEAQPGLVRLVLREHVSIVW